MPIYIYEDNAFEKMIRVEGEYYRKFKTIEEFGDCSFDAFQKAWKKLADEINEETRAKYPDAHITVNGNGAIYGDGGWNRYCVSWTGEIIFLEQLAMPPKYETIDKAKAAGFNTMY